MNGIANGIFENIFLVPQGFILRPIMISNYSDSVLCEAKQKNPDEFRRRIKLVGLTLHPADTSNADVRVSTERCLLTWMS